MMERMKNKLQTKMVIILTAVSVIALIAVGVMAAMLFQRDDRPQITSNLVSERLSEISELATMKLQYRDISHFEEGSITYITKKSFNMIYDAEIKVGVDLNKVSVQVQGGQVVIELPKAEIFTIEINPDTIEFYDERYALFNWENKQDTVEVLKKAKEDVAQMVEDREVYSQAEEQAKVLIQNLLNPLTGSGENQLEISFAEDTNAV